MLWGNVLDCCENTKYAFIPSINYVQSVLQTPLRLNHYCPREGKAENARIERFIDKEEEIARRKYP